MQAAGYQASGGILVRVLAAKRQWDPCLNRVFNQCILVSCLGYSRGGYIEFIYVHAKVSPGSDCEWFQEADTYKHRLAASSLPKGLFELTVQASFAHLTGNYAWAVSQNSLVARKWLPLPNDGIAISYSTRLVKKTTLSGARSSLHQTRRIPEEWGLRGASPNSPD